MATARGLSAATRAQLAPHVGVRAEALGTAVHRAEPRDVAPVLCAKGFVEERERRARVTDEGGPGPVREGERTERSGRVESFSDDASALRCHRFSDRTVHLRPESQVTSSARKSQSGEAGRITPLASSRARWNARRRVVGVRARRGVRALGGAARSRGRRTRCTRTLEMTSSGSQSMGQKTSGGASARCANLGWSMRSLQHDSARRASAARGARGATRASGDGAHAARQAAHANDLGDPPGPPRSTSRLSKCPRGPRQQTHPPV